MPQEIGGRKVIIVAQGESPTSGGGEQMQQTHETVGTAAEHEAPENPLAENPPFYYTGVAAFVILAIIAFALFCTSKGLKLRSASRRQTLLEQAVASITFFSRNAIGEGGEKFAPLIGTVFSFILVSNLMGVLPTVWKRNHEGGLYSATPAPTSNLSMTLAIALLVFVYVQYIGIKENGIGGYIKHFAGPVKALSPLIFPLEIIGAISKPLSLSIRLFGNVFGEETVIAVLIALGVSTLGWYLPIPFQLPMLVFGVFGSIVQAGVFTILTCAYIGLAIGEHGEHDGHGADGNGHEPHDLEDEFGAHVGAKPGTVAAAH